MSVSEIVVAGDEASRVIRDSIAATGGLRSGSDERRERYLETMSKGSDGDKSAIIAHQWKDAVSTDGSDEKGVCICPLETGIRVNLSDEFDSWVVRLSFGTETTVLDKRPSLELSPDL